jgi:hypothetical protein
MATKLKGKRPSQQQIESDVVEIMTLAHTMAIEIFGDKASFYAADEIYDYFTILDDPDEVKTDVQRVYGHAKQVFQTASPTPEQVFGLFDRIYNDDEE